MRPISPLLFELSAELRANAWKPCDGTKLLRKSARNSRKGSGPSHPGYAETQAGQAMAFALLGDTDSAIRAAKAGEDTGREHLR